MKNEKKDRLNKTGGDSLHAIVRGGVSAIPVAGGPLLELFNELVTQPLSARRDAWIREIASGLDQLKEQVGQLNPENFAKSDAFVTAVAHASQIATRTHQDEKRAALRAAVLNIANGAQVDDNLQLIFLRMIDDFTPWHLRVLAVLHDPSAFSEAKRRADSLMIGAFSDILEAVHPELRGRGDFVRLVIQDLHRAGLTSIDNINVTVSQGSFLTRKTTPLGTQFLTLITSPIES